MILKYNKRTKDDLIAIFTFIRESPDVIDTYELMDFITEYDYYLSFYKNYHVIKDYIEYHNSHLGKVKPVVEVDNSNIEDLLKF